MAFSNIEIKMLSKCSTTICDDSFYYLDAPPERICGADVPMPYAANLEALAVPQVSYTVNPKGILIWKRFGKPM
jgi:pyruvate/2-oxoglutarate/acetoin dehydrogenase E1 component